MVSGTPMTTSSVTCTSAVAVRTISLCYLLLLDSRTLCLWRARCSLWLSLMMMVLARSSIISRFHRRLTQPSSRTWSMALHKKHPSCPTIPNWAARSYSIARKGWVGASSNAMNWAVRVCHSRWWQRHLRRRMMKLPTKVLTTYTSSSHHGQELRCSSSGGQPKGPKGWSRRLFAIFRLMES